MTSPSAFAAVRRRVCLSTPDGSRSEITLAPNTDGSHTVRNTGHARLWSHLEDAHHLWDAARRPGWPRLGLAVTPHTRTLCADEPDNTIATLSNGNSELRNVAPQVWGWEQGRELRVLIR